MDHFEDDCPGLTMNQHLGRSLKENYDELCRLNEEYQLNVCGEGGEYETFTLDYPLFKKRIVMHGPFLVAAISV